MLLCLSVTPLAYKTTFTVVPCHPILMFVSLAWTEAHRMHLLVQLLMCCLQYDDQEFISGYHQKHNGEETHIINWKQYSELPWYVSIGNYYTENSIAADKRWITHIFHQECIQLVDLILPQAIMDFIIELVNSLSYTAKNTFGEILSKQRKKLQRLSADLPTCPMVSGNLKPKGQSDHLVWASYRRH